MKRKMTRARGKAAAAGCLTFLLLSSSCFTIEHEIFLKDDGSGLYVMHVSVPNPEEEAAGGVASREESREMLTEIKETFKRIKAKGVTLKDVKEVDKNDLSHIYVSLSFDNIANLAKVVDKLWASDKEKKGKGKKGKKGKGKKDKAAKDKDDPKMDWKVQLVKKGKETKFSSSYVLIMDETEKKDKKPAEAENGAEDMDMFGDEMANLIAAMGKVRFVLHAPGEIKDSNADMTIGNQAVWEGALSIFTKPGGKLQMEATF